MDPKPTLDINKLEFCETRHREWKRHMKNLIRQSTRMNRIVHKWRKKQECLIGSDQEDPDPYKPTYVFYCLEASDVN
jgi:hypothetical protein